MTKPLSRRRALVGVTLGLSAPAGACRADALLFTVYRSPSCDCCQGWIDHMTRAGYRPRSVMVDDLAVVRRRYRVPDDMAACHTAVIDGYAIEGHVPATDVTDLLRQRPKAIGIAVPGMPLGSPGMEQPGGVREAFSTILLLEDSRRRTFAQH